LIPYDVKLLFVLTMLALAERPLDDPASQDATELHDPPGHTAAFKLHTLPTSVQVYTCKAGAWTGPDPDAVLTNDAGTLTIHHYSGPTWEATGGSIVQGKNAKHFLAPKAGAVDWLELTASNGTQEFAQVDFIHRIDTAGGVPPSRPCDAAHEQERVRVPYSATYLFYSLRALHAALWKLV
jgi:hypothetical protein